MINEDFRLFREFVADNYGMLLEQGAERTLTAKLAPRLAELRLASLAEYYCYLKFAPGGEAERQRFIPLITNNETYFFREAAQFALLADEVLPRLKEEKLARRERVIRILCAGCSSGEEAYSLAMALREAGHFAWDWEVEVVGVDLDPRAVDAARRGIYGERSFRAVDPGLWERYLKPSGDLHVVRDMVRKWTRFVQGNLLEAASLPPGPFDIVFCRNVLIYFDAETMGRVVRNLGSLQREGGLLFLGHSESLSRSSVPYLPLRFPSAIIYRKKG